VRHDQDAAVSAATVADDVHFGLLKDLLGRVAGCFPRRQTRQSCGQIVRGLLMELEDHNCWTIAEAVGHRGPHRLQAGKYVAAVASGAAKRNGWAIAEQAGDSSPQRLLNRAAWDGRRAR
jgi:hypothetical protein